MRLFTAAIAAGLVLLAAATTLEAPFVILGGWVSFLRRVLPEVKPDGPSVMVGAIALVLFGAGVHGLGRSWRRTAKPDAGPWRIRWTAAVVLGVVLLFTAGISVVAVTHQVAWLATSEQPLVAETAGRAGDPKWIGLALADYRSTYHALPPGGTFSADGEMRHSWETHLLPYLTYSTAGIDMNRPWNGAENRTYFQCVLPDFINPGFRSPSLEDGGGFGLSHYAANSRLMSANRSTASGEIARGLSNTLAIGEVNTGFVPWGHPVNWRDPAAGLNAGANTFGGPPRANGTTFVMADGSVRLVSNGIDPAVLRAMSAPRADE